MWQEVESQTISNQLAWSSLPASYSCLLIFFLLTSLSSHPRRLIQIRIVIKFWGRQLGHRTGKIRPLSPHFLPQLFEGVCFLWEATEEKQYANNHSFFSPWGKDRRQGGFRCPWMMIMMGRGKYLLTVRFLNGSTIIIILSAAGQKGRIVLVELEWEGREGDCELWTRRKDNGCPRVALEIILSCRDATPETYFRINNFRLFGFGILWCTLRISENVIEKDEREEIREENICFARSRFDKNQREIGPKSPIRANRDTVSEIVITFHCLWSRGSLSIDLFNSVKIIQEMLKSEFSLKLWWILSQLITEISLFISENRSAPSML